MFHGWPGLGIEIWKATKTVVSLYVDTPVYRCIYDGVYTFLHLSHAQGLVPGKTLIHKMVEKT